MVQDHPFITQAANESDYFPTAKDLADEAVEGEAKPLLTNEKKKTKKFYGGLFKKRW